MSSSDGEYEDRCPRERRSVRELLEEKGHLLAAFGSELDRTGASLERVHRAWDTGFRETITRLDQIVAQVDEAARLTRVLVARRRRPAP
jgi:hypothetical protein